MQNNSQRGIVKLIVLIIVVIIILSYLGINIQKIAESDTGRSNFGYVWQWVLKAWDWLRGLYQQYLGGSLGPLWEKITQMAPFLNK